MRTLLPLGVLAVVAVAASLAAPVAGADVFETIQLVSAGTTAGSSLDQQSEKAEHAAIAGNGQYVVFQGAFGGVNGIWRRDLSSGAIEQVAGGAAELPSISETGQYISFTTNEGAALPTDTDGQPHAAAPEAPNVWVRDMSKAPTEAGAFRLASAANVDGEPLVYTSSQATHFGSIASGRTAISANGRYVAFVTTAVSNLAGSETPPDQVAVRDLLGEQTKLVSVEANPATGVPIEAAPGQDLPVPYVEEGGNHYGAVYSPEAAPPQFPFRFPWVGASISADGSTVAWLGQEVARQSQVLALDEAQKPSYAEPLWRRIEAGPSAPTRRITGGSDPANPLCAASGETALPPGEPTLANPCQGPFEAKSPAGTPGTYTASSDDDYLPQLSSNGDTVAFLASVREIATGLELATAPENDTNLYVANMAEGLTRVQALRRLTEVAGGTPQEVGRTGGIVDLGISPDGSQVAFGTRRTLFPLGSPAYVTAPSADPGEVELFDVDLGDDTLTRVTHGFERESEPSEQPLGAVPPPGVDLYTDADGSFSPSFSDDDDTLAFSSTAANLVFGDGNQASDAFIVRRRGFPSMPTPQYVSPEPPGPAPTPLWLLGATALARANGSVLLYVETPGAGSLRAAAVGAVEVKVTRTSRASRRRGAASGRKHTSTTVAMRTVASASKRSSSASGGLITLTLTLSSRYRALANARGGMSANVALVFTAAGHPTLKLSVPVTFLHKIKVPAKRRGRAAANSRHRAGAR